MQQQHVICAANKLGVKQKYNMDYSQTVRFHCGKQSYNASPCWIKDKSRRNGNKGAHKKYAGQCKKHTPLLTRAIPEDIQLADNNVESVENVIAFL